MIQCRRTQLSHLNMADAVYTWNKISSGLIFINSLLIKFTAEYVILLTLDPAWKHLWTKHIKLSQLAGFSLDVSRHDLGLTSSDDPRCYIYSMSCIFQISTYISFFILFLYCVVYSHYFCIIKVFVDKIHTISASSIVFCLGRSDPELMDHQVDLGIQLGTFEDGSTCLPDFIYAFNHLLRSPYKTPSFSVAEPPDQMLSVIMDSHCLRNCISEKCTFIRIFCDYYFTANHRVLFNLTANPFGSTKYTITRDRISGWKKALR